MSFIVQVEASRDLLKLYDEIWSLTKQFYIAPQNLSNGQASQKVTCNIVDLHYLVYL